MWYYVIDGVYSVPEKGVIALLFVKKAVTLENIKVYLVIVVKKLTLPNTDRR